MLEAVPRQKGAGVNAPAIRLVGWRAGKLLAEARPDLDVADRQGVRPLDQVGLPRGDVGRM
jgi:hypothetical protein